MTMIDSDALGPPGQLAVSLLLGLLVGLQRQWADSRLGGIRTFALVSFLGTICALLAEEYGGWLVALGFLGTIAGIALGDLKNGREGNRQKHSVLVTEFAMMLMFTIGVFVHHAPPWLAAALAGGLAILMQAKLELHGIVARFSAREIRAIMQFVLISLVILPVVPDQTFGPYGVFNPREAWLMVVLIVAIGLVGYIIYKFLGKTAGIALSGALGGLISSTATTFSCARSKGNISYTAVVIAIACTILYPRILLAAHLAAPQFRELIAPLCIMCAASGLAAFLLWLRVESKYKGMPPQENPTELKAALAFGVLYSVAQLAVAFAKDRFGNAGMTAVALLSGMTDMDVVTLSTVRLVANGRLEDAEAWRLIVTGIVSNTFFKGGIVFILGGRLLFSKLIPFFGATATTGIALLFLWK